MRGSSIFCAACAFCFLFAIAASATAQWDASEAPQRLENRQWDKIDEQTREQLHGPGLLPQKRTTKGDKILMELSNIPTGYLYREFAVRQGALRGKWDKALLMPAPGFEKKWGYVDQTKYNDALASGIIDDKIKGTTYDQFYNDMKKACGTGIAAKGKIHVRIDSAQPEWMTSQSPNPPHILYREIPFECLAEGDRK